MSWIKLDDQIFTHPKLVDLSKDAKLLYLAGLCYCGAQLTDGLITKGATRVLLATIEANCEAIASLIDAELWEANDSGGFLVHDYLEHQSSRDEVLAVKGARAKAGQAGGVKSGEARRAKREANEANGQAKSKQIQSTDTDTESESIERVTAPPITGDIAPESLAHGASRDMQSTGRAIIPGVTAPKPQKQAALPRPYALTEEMRAWAAMETPDLADRIDGEHKKFCNHYWSKAERRADWRPAWETWMMRAVDEFAPKSQKGSTANGSHYQSADERKAARFAQWADVIRAGQTDDDPPAEPRQGLRLIG